MGEEEREEEGPQTQEWEFAIVMFILFVIVGIVLVIPTQTIDIGFGRTIAYAPYGTIGWFFIGISWIWFLWPIYKNYFARMSETYGEAIGRGISRGLRRGKVCPECSTINDVDFKICPECGYKWPIRSGS